MSNPRDISPAPNPKKSRTRRKLPFCENINSSPEVELNSKEATPEETPSLTPRRTTPLTERQQIALLCRLSAGSSTESSPVNENVCKSQLLKRNERGETSLHLASIRGDFEKVKVLLKQGANPNTADFAGWTPLHEACNHGWFKTAKLLIQFGADVNSLGFDNFTPLHDAAVNKHEEVVQLLLKHGANPLQENINRDTPLDLARSEYIEELLKNAIQCCNSNRYPGADCLRTPEVALGKRQFIQSPCRPSSPLCDLTMRKNSPQNQTQKGADKPTSPRLTLRFQSIRSRDDKSCHTGTPQDLSNPHQPKYPSYCVTMETAYDTAKKEDCVTSSTATPPPPEKDTAVECVTSTTADEKAAPSAEESPDKDKAESKHPAEAAPLKISSSRASTEQNVLSEDESKRKRRKSDESRGSHRSHKSPSGKTDGQSPKARNKRGSVSSSDTESNPSELDATNTVQSEAPESSSPKVPPLKIVLNSGSMETESRERSNSKVASSKPALPYVVNTTTAEAMDTSNSDVPCSSPANAVDGTPVKQESGAVAKLKEDGLVSTQRVTRSSQRMQAATTTVTTTTGSTTTTSASLNQCSSNSPESSGSNMVSSSSQKDEAHEFEEASGNSSNDESMEMQIMDVVPPRKRKLKIANDYASENCSRNIFSSVSSSPSLGSDTQKPQQPLNGIQLHMQMRQLIRKRQLAMTPIRPSPPEGFKNYLLNKCNYLLEGKQQQLAEESTFLNPPADLSLEVPMQDLYQEQARERYKLICQQTVEREKLILSYEQEILRDYTRKARASANQPVPLSACSILKDEDICNGYDVCFYQEEKEEKGRRDRYNNRTFNTWIQDTKEKWESIRAKMLIRHHNEAEALNHIQRLHFKWKITEIQTESQKKSTKADIYDEKFVPMVAVNDESFQLTEVGFTH